MNTHETKAGSNGKFQLFAAIIVTFFTFSTYIGYAIHGGNLGASLFKSGDFFRASYPGFIKVGSYLKEGHLSAVDLGVNNGNGEMFLRASLPAKNLIYDVFAYSSAVLDNRFADHFLFALILFTSFLCFYYAQKLASEFFNLDRYQALFFAVVGFVPVIVFDSLFVLLFHFNITLVSGLAYFSLKALQSPRHNWLAAAFFYVLVFTGGYITVATFQAAVNILFVVIYYASTQEKYNIKLMLHRIGLPFVVATAACFLHYLAITQLLTDVVQTSMKNYYQSVDQLAVDFTDIVGLVTPFRSFTKPLEQLTIASIGVIGISILLIAFEPIISKSKKFKFSAVFWFGVLSTLTICFWSMGSITNIPGVFHFFAPIIGSMYLQYRYLVPVKPFLILSVALAIYYLNSLDSAEKQRLFSIVFRILGVGFLVLAIVILLHPTVGTETLRVGDIRRFSIELLFAGVFFVIASIEGIKKKALLVACTYTLTVYPGVMQQQLPLPTFDDWLVVEKINYNKHAVAGMNQFIDTLEDREVYRYLGMEELGTSGHKAYLTEQLEWFKILDHNISNYSSYDVYISNPKDYQPLFFTIMGTADWQYIANTRASFVVIDDDVYAKNKAVLDTMIDTSVTPYFMHWKPNSGTKAYALKEFVPKQMSGGDFTLDPNPNSLDNGYFYSPDLEKEALVEFESNDADYVRAVINADKPSRMTYLFYPIQNQLLYIDGEIVEPTIDKAQMFFDIPAGTHTIELKYKNSLESVGNRLLILFYLVVFLYFLGFYLSKYINIYIARKEV